MLPPPNRRIGKPTSQSPDKNLSAINEAEEEISCVVKTLIPEIKTSIKDAATHLEILEKNGSNYNTQMSDSEAILPSTQPSVRNSPSNVIIEGTPRNSDSVSKPTDFKPQLDFQETQDIGETSLSQAVIGDSPRFDVDNTPTIQRRTRFRKDNFKLTQPIFSGTPPQRRAKTTRPNNLTNFETQVVGTVDSSPDKPSLKSPQYDKGPNPEDLDGKDPAFFQGVENTQAIPGLRKQVIPIENGYTQFTDSPGLAQEVGTAQNILPSSGNNLDYLQSNDTHENIYSDIEIPGTSEKEKTDETDQFISQNSLLKSPDFAQHPRSVDNDFPSANSDEKSDKKQLYIDEPSNSSSHLLNLSGPDKNHNSQDVNLVVPPRMAKRRLIIESDEEGEGYSVLNDSVDNRINGGLKYNQDPKNRKNIKKTASESQKNSTDLNTSFKQKHNGFKSKEHQSSKRQRSNEYTDREQLPPSSPPESNISNDSSVTPKSTHELPDARFDFPSAVPDATSYPSVIRVDDPLISSQLASLPPIDYTKPSQPIITSVWAKIKSTYVPAQVLTSVEFDKLKDSSNSIYDSLLANDRVPVGFADGSWSEVRFNDTVVLDLFPGDQVKYKHDKLVYDIIEVFDSKSEYGKEIIQQFHQEEKSLGSMKKKNVATSIKPPRSYIQKQRQKTSRHTLSLNQASTTKPSFTDMDSTDFQVSEFVVRANNGGNMVILKSTANEKKRTKSKIVKSNPQIVVPVSDLYLTLNLGTKLYKTRSKYHLPQTSTTISNHTKYSNSIDITSSVLRNNIPSSYTPRRSTRTVDYNESSSEEDEINVRFRKSKSTDDVVFSATSTSKNSYVSRASSFGRCEKVRSRSFPKSNNFHKLGAAMPGIFTGCIFTVTHAETALNEKNQWNELEEKIEAEGGVILRDGFSEMLNINVIDFFLDWPKVRKSHSPLERVNSTSKNNSHANLLSGKDLLRNGNDTKPYKMSTSLSSYNKTGDEPFLVEGDTEDSNTCSAISQDYRFAAVLANEATRTPKYLEALCLGYPCLSTQFISDCFQDGFFLPNWTDYLLSAGTSIALKGAQKSLNVLNFLHLWTSGKCLEDQFYSRCFLLNLVRAPIYLIEDTNLSKALSSKDHVFTVVPDLMKSSIRATNTESNSTALVDKNTTRLNGLSDYKNEKKNKGHVFRSLLLLAGCSPQNITVPTKVSDIQVDREEGAIIIVTSKDDTPTEFSRSKSRKVLNCLKKGECLQGQVLIYNREWIIQCIINQQLI